MAVTLAKIEFADRPATERATWVERGVHQGKTFRTERTDVRRDLGIDFKLLQTTQHVEIARLPFYE